MRQVAKLPPVVIAASMRHDAAFCAFSAPTSAAVMSAHVQRARFDLRDHDASAGHHADVQCADSICVLRVILATLCRPVSVELEWVS